MYIITSQFGIMFYCRWKFKKLCNDSIDCESIDKIDFMVFEEELPLEFDINEFESILFHDNVILTVDDSLIKVKINV